MGYNYRGYGGGGGGQGRPGGGQFNVMGSMTPAVMYLIIANVACFIATTFLPAIVLHLGLVPDKVFTGAQLWRIGTYLFFHADFAHILFNMLMLYFFGRPLEQVWGMKKFLTYYFVCGVGAGIVCVPFYILLGVGAKIIIGASGALFGLFVAFGLLYPNATVLLGFIIPIKAKYMVLIFAVLEWVATMSYLGGNFSSNIASAAHLSGMAIGFIYLRGFMDLKAWHYKFKTRRKQKAYRVINGEDVRGEDDQRDDDQRGPWVH